MTKADVVMAAPSYRGLRTAGRRRTAGFVCMILLNSPKDSTRDVSRSAHGKTVTQLVGGRTKTQTQACPAPELTPAT